MREPKVKRCSDKKKQERKQEIGNKTNRKTRHKQDINKNEKRMKIRGQKRGKTNNKRTEKTEGRREESRKANEKYEQTMDLIYPFQKPKMAADLKEKVTGFSGRLLPSASTDTLATSSGWTVGEPAYIHRR